MTAAPNFAAPLAHVALDGRVHALSDHLREVARRSAEHANAFGGAECAALAGLWHDLGKYAEDFQGMLRAAGAADAHVETESEIGSRKRVDHSTAGALYAAQRAPDRALPICFAIAGHHAGLADRAALRDRLKDRGPGRLDAALSMAPPAEILQTEVPPLPDHLCPSSARDLDAYRRLELFTRMVFSALCDADFLDTEAFFDSARTALRGGHRPLAELCHRLSAHVDGLTRQDSTVNRARAEVRAACVAAAPLAPGLFTLTVPTGGGKTLAAMELALRHALVHGLRRVVVAIPYTSILEQNAAVYRRAFALEEGDTSVLEHHSSIDPRAETARNRLAAENWDPPIVVTTNVQLFESLFARRPGACRKLHNLARSVIILDEAQTLPRGLLAPTTDVLEALARDYGCTIVLCTATQPALTRAVLGDCGLGATTEIAPDPHALADRLRRVDVDWSRARTPTTWAALANELAREPDVLAIVHRRDDARDLCAAIDAIAGDASTVHLSALMCPAHRKLVLADIRERKARAEPVRVVSTQLVEAGVDLDFPVVYRALAGIDSLTQAAGRCNREGRLRGRGKLRVYLAPTSPPKGILVQGLEVTRTMLREDLDLFAPAVHEEYFARLYRAGGDDVHDTAGVQRLRAELAFERVANAYRVIDDAWSAPLVVPFDARARQAVASIDHLGPSRARLRELGRVTVNVSKRDLEHWLRTGAVATHGDDTVHVLVGDGAYDARFGLVPELVGTLAPKDSVV
ncbi:MAG: CRISPR-associated endonuclease Cas3'' [Polyangiaceae bacterium]|nr:CRISPR-associated endonuclease Cas3'' [Polyangiaceae bacterium]